MLFARTIVAVMFTVAVLATPQVVHGTSSLRGEKTTTTSNRRSLIMGRGKKHRDDNTSHFDKTNGFGVSPCDPYDDIHAVGLCKAFCDSDCNTMERLAVHHGSVSNDSARNSTKRSSKSKSSSDDGMPIVPLDDLSCTDLQSAFRDITGEDVPCLSCPCWTKKTIMEAFADRDLITDDSCYDYLPGEDSQIYLSDNVSFALAQDDLNGLFGNSTHYCLTDSIGPLTIDEKTARICVETLASYCAVIGKPVVEYALPPI